MRITNNESKLLHTSFMTVGDDRYRDLNSSDMLFKSQEAEEKMGNPYQSAEFRVRKNRMVIAGST